MRANALLAGAPCPHTYPQQPPSKEHPICGQIRCLRVAAGAITYAYCNDAGAIANPDESDKQQRRRWGGVRNDGGESVFDGRAIACGPRPQTRVSRLCCAQLLRGMAARTTRKFDVAPTLSELREHAPCRRTRWIEHLRLELRTETQGGLVSPKPAATRSVGKEAVMLTCRRTTQGRSRASTHRRRGDRDHDHAHASTCLDHHSDPPPPGLAFL